MTAKLTDLSDSDIVINMFIVCRHVMISKWVVSYWFYSYLNTVCSTFNLQVCTSGGTQVVNATAVAKKQLFFFVADARERVKYRHMPIYLLHAYV